MLALMSLMVVSSVIVNNISLYAILLAIAMCFYICIGLRLSTLCKRLGLNPPFPLGPFDKINFFIFVNEMSQLPENSQLRLWVLLQNGLLCVIVVLLIILLIEFAA